MLCFVLFFVILFVVEFLLAFVAVFVVVFVFIVFVAVFVVLTFVLPGKNVTCVYKNLALQFVRMLSPSLGSLRLHFALSLSVWHTLRSLALEAGNDVTDFMLLLLLLVGAPFATLCYCCCCCC